MCQQLLGGCFSTRSAQPGLTNGFSKKLDSRVAALKTTPAKALGVVDRAWAIGDLIDAALATEPITPVPDCARSAQAFPGVHGGKL